MTSNGVKIRNLSPSDYDAIIGVVDDWWGGRRMASMLPRLFFEHFTDTSFAAEAHGSLAGFLVGSALRHGAVKPISISPGPTPPSRDRGWAADCMRPSSRRLRGGAARSSAR